jgi:hypothetical protein
MASINDLLTEGFRNVVPMDARTYVSTLFGNREPITEKNFTQKELAGMQELINESQKRGGQSVQYKDYEKFVRKNARPEYGPQIATESTLGRFNYQTSPNQTVITDRYDFSNPQRQEAVQAYNAMPSWQKPFEVIKRSATLNPALMGMKLASELGNAYIGNEGRDVNIKFDPQALANSLRNK